MIAEPPPANTDPTLRLSRTQLAFVEDDHPLVLFLGGVGAGKSYAGAVRALRRRFGRARPSLGLVIAPTFGMLRDATWRTAREVWAPVIERVLANEMRLVLRTGDEVLFRSADDPDRLRGPNASWLWIDEASGCHPETWPIALGRLRQHGVSGEAWLTTTPKGLDWVYDVFVTNATDATTYHRASTWANPFVDPAFVAGLRTQYTTELARQEIEAEWIADVEGGLLEWRWLEQAAATAKRDDPFLPVTAGIDVAGPGDAETVLCVRAGDAVLDLVAWNQPDPRGEVIAALERWKPRGLDAVNVDVVGIGHYFALALEDAGLPVCRVNVGEAPTDDTARHRFANLRAQLFWTFREWAAEGMLSGLTDRTCLGQLASLRYDHDHRGRVRIERKEDARRRGVKSPDRAEAVVLAFWSAPKPRLTGVIGKALTRQARPRPQRLPFLSGAR